MFYNEHSNGCNQDNYLHWPTKQQESCYFLYNTCLIFVLKSYKKNVYIYEQEEEYHSINMSGLSALRKIQALPRGKYWLQALNSIN